MYVNRLCQPDACIFLGNVIALRGTKGKDGCAHNARTPRLLNVFRCKKMSMCVMHVKLRCFRMVLNGEIESAEMGGGYKKRGVAAMCLMLSTVTPG